MARINTISFPASLTSRTSVATSTNQAPNQDVIDRKSFGNSGFLPPPQETSTGDAKEEILGNKTFSTGVRQALIERQRKEIKSFFDEVLKERKAKEDELRKNLEKELAVTEYTVLQGKPKKTASFETKDEEYIKDGVNFLFVAEYKTSNVNGSLLCWEPYSKGDIVSTHYEVWRKDFFSQNSEYRKVGIGYTAEQLQKERDGGEKNPGLLPYINQVLKLNKKTENANSFIYFLDLSIEKDRIYGYKILGVSYPKGYLINYKLLLEQKDKLTKVDSSLYSNVGLSEMAVRLFNDERFAWIISLVNNDVSYFGNSTKSNINTNNSNINVPTDIAYINNIIQESTVTFGSWVTLHNILTIVGGLTGDIFTSALKSVNRSNNTFSFDDFKEEIKKSWPFFDLTLKALIATKTQEQVETLLGVDFPPQEGSVDISNIIGITIMIDYIERVVSVLLAGEDRTKVENLQNLVLKKSENVIEDIASDYIDGVYGEAIGSLGVYDLSKEGIEEAVSDATSKEVLETYNLISDEDFSEDGASQV